MLTSPHIQPADIRIETIYPGAFARPMVAHVHAKTCPHLIWAQSAMGQYEIKTADGRHELLNEGEAFLIAANIPMEITHHGNPNRNNLISCRWIHAQFTLIGNIDIASLIDMPLRISTSQCAAFESIHTRLTELNENATGDTLSTTAHRYQLAGELLSVICELSAPREHAERLVGQKERLSKVLNFMDAHLGEKLSVKQLARQANMSAPHFYAFFRQFVGRSPMKHLKYMRLQKACSLLAETDEKLINIAEQTGFCNEFHLSREFKKTLGKAPGKWRRDFDSTI